MSIFKTKGYRNIDCILSIAAIFPPIPRNIPDGKTDDESAFHLTIVNKKDMEDEKSTYIALSKKQLKQLGALIDGYLKTGTTKEI